MTDVDRLQQITDWVARNSHHPTETFTMARMYAEGLLAQVANEDKLTKLENLLRSRFKMARKVLDDAGHNNTAVLIPIEEVLFWIRDLREEDA